MKILEKVNWGYILFETDDGIFLDVVCGTVAIFDIIIHLTDEEIKNHYASSGFIKDLADKICSNPKAYESRQVTTKFEFPEA